MLKAKVLVLLLGFSCSLWAQPHPNDVAGAQDFARIERFPRSYIDEYQQREAPQYQLVLGRILRKGGGSVPDEVKWLYNGQLKRLTYRIPSGHSTREVFRYFLERLERQNAEILYQCRSRACGDSNVWANQVFDIAQLYGPDRQQAYLAARLSGSVTGRDIYVALYVIERGNRRLYAHMDVLTVQNENRTPDPEEWLAQLQQRGRLVTDIRFTPEGDLAAESDETLRLLAQMLQQDTRQPVYVVGHLAGQQTVEQLLQLSRQRAERVVEALRQQGVDNERLSAYGVGPLAPPYRVNIKVDRIELVVLNPVAGG